MKISTKGRYGLRVMVELAKRYGQGPVLAETIAVSQDISGKYIHVLVGGLRTAGLIRTARGPSGGYELTRSPSSVTALDVVSALEGRTAPVNCVIDISCCRRARGCATRDLWREVAAAIDGVLSGATLEQLAAKQHAQQDEPSDFCI